MANKWKDKSFKTWKESWEKGNIGNSLSSIDSGITGIVQAGVNNAKIADTTEEEMLIDSTGSTQFSSGSFDNLLSDFNSLDMARTNYTSKELRGLTAGQMAGNTWSGISSGAIAGAKVGGPWGAVAGAVAGLAGGLSGIFTGNAKARNKANELNYEAKKANELYLGNINNAVLNTKNTMFNNSLLNLAAKGGKIYIKPENRGKFTEYCGGKVTSECINRGKKSTSPAVRKRAVFAENARKWHSLGGNLFEAGGLMHQHGGIFSNGVVTIGNGGTHEQNPFDGVQIGIDPQGVPNMVEEGEVIWNDYVFSNRLKPTQEFKDKYKVKGNTFADVAKEMQKESEERPNDPISKRGLDDSLTKLMIEQENLRQENEMNNNKRMFNTGGKVKLPKYVNVEEEIVDEDNSALDNFWGGVATTPEQRLAIMEMDPTNAAYKKPSKRTNNYLRYAPVLGSGLSVISDLFGNTNTPDFSEAKLIRNAVDSINPIGFTPVGGYLSYNPLDPNYIGAQLAAQAASGRRAVAEQSINPGMAISGLLALNQGSQKALGEAYRQGLEYNQAQRERVAGFNRQTDAMNAEMALKTAMANKEADALRFKGALAEAELMAKEKQQASAARSANITNLFDNLGLVGKEEAIRELIKNNPYLLYDDNGKYKGSNTGAKGGYLTIKNKRRKK